MTTAIEGDVPPALLTKNEVLFLSGKLQASPGYQRKLRHDINRKLQTLSKLELPLLIEQGYTVEGVTAGCNVVTANCNAEVAAGRALPWEEGIAYTGDNERGASGGTSGAFDTFEPATSTLPR